MGARSVPFDIPTLHFPLVLYLRRFSDQASQRQTPLPAPAGPRIVATGEAAARLQPGDAQPVEGNMS